MQYEGAPSHTTNNEEVLETEENDINSFLLGGKKAIISIIINIISRCLVKSKPCKVENLSQTSEQGEKMW